ncbi:helix-turn-helix domain-containing protein [Hymenobacter negativus]|uniref:Helix-turn-helix transcriptional regulator n=1 Tax=Hymenobacter negativus TaxID=2795026 RepID=A0ABS3QP51_9BACT|nr:helix-turn-helix transcriptional regulator [Hymenobacter negativus]MBO2012698.1 helix-turn-helix transcriptional regulator [Hymenobacter negativus]
MPRRSLYSNAPDVDLRAHFGLTQAELGRFLGVTAAQVGHVEAGRNAWSVVALRRLRLLEWLMPPADGGLGPEPPAWATAVPVALPELPGGLDAMVLQQRLREVHFQAIKARYELGKRHKLVRAHARRQWGVAVLRALLAPAVGKAPTPAPVVSSPVFDAEAVGRWLATLQADAAAAPVPLTPTQQALLTLRLRLLEEEAAALEALLQ